MVAENEIAAHILKWINNEKPGPLVLEIHPTYRCNLDCLFCSFARARERNLMDYSVELPTEKWIKIMEMAASAHVREVRVCGGGEPAFYNKRFTRIMLKIKELCMTGYLTTNGTLLDEKTSLKMVKSGWDAIEFSLNGACSETDDLLRGKKGTFERTTNAIRFFNTLKKRSNVQKPRLKINTVVTNKNFREIPNVIELAHCLGIEEIVLLKLNPDSPNKNLLELNCSDAEELLRIIDRVSGTCAEFGIKLTSDSFIDLDKKFTKTQRRYRRAQKSEGLTAALCYEPWYYLQIMNDGSVSPCCNGLCNRDTETLHNHSLMELWGSGRHLSSIRKGILNGILHERCRGCCVGDNRSAEIRKWMKG